MGNSPRPVGGKLTCHRFEITFQVAFHCLSAFVVEAAAGQINQLAGQFYRILMPLNQNLRDHSLSLGVEPEYLNTFLPCLIAWSVVRPSAPIQQCVPGRGGRFAVDQRSV